MRRQTDYILTDYDFEVKQKIGVLLELLGEDFEIICAINGWLDFDSEGAIPSLDYRIMQLQEQTGNYGPYLAEPIDMNSKDIGLLMNKADNQMKKRDIKVICKRK